MSSPDLEQLLEALQRLASHQASKEDLDFIWNARTAHLADCRTISTSNESRVKSLEAFNSTYSSVQSLWQSQGISTDVDVMLWLYWLPLAEAIATQYQSLDRPMIQGLLGGQGTGKTTLCKILVSLLGYFGITAHALSIDDLYKTYSERQQLLIHDPRLVWRGPPGTHDVELGLDIFRQVLDSDTSKRVKLPQFDKYAFNGQGDRTKALSIPKPDLLLFEGWFVGVRPVAEERFVEPPAPITSESDQTFALDMNRALGEYLPLWNQLDSLLVLNPEDYRLSLSWRWDAESKAIAQGKTGLSQLEITQFVEYFWKALHPELFISELLEQPDRVDYVLEINAAHQPVRLYSPS